MCPAEADAVDDHRDRDDAPGAGDVGRADDGTHGNERIARRAAAQRRAAAVASAEAVAARFLAGRGLTIVARNFRCRRGEIDLVARDGATLVFVEVRLRRGASHGGAGESITAAKRARLVAAAQFYLLRVPGPPPCRFDAILLDGLDPARVDWRRNVIDAD
jgi:putative endonuclease